MLRSSSIANKSKGRPAPRIIFLAVGEAMRPSRSDGHATIRFRKGIPEGDTLLEDQSTTTLENMQFSKRLITQEIGESPYEG